MSVVKLGDLERFARSVAPDRHDGYSERALAHAYEEYLPRRRSGLASFELTTDGKPATSFYSALEDPSGEFESGEIVLVNPPAPGPVWDYLVPFERVRLMPDGAAEVVPINGTGEPRRAIARILLREHYVPRSAAQDGAVPNAGQSDRIPTELGPLAAAAKFYRTAGVVPFSVALLLYFADERLRLEFDLAESRLLPDVRAGRFPLARRVRRTPRIAHGVDAYIARGDLPLLETRALEVLFETHGLTAIELSNVFGGLKELVESTLQGLTARRLVTYDRRTGVYRPRLDAFLTSTDRTVSREEPTGPHAHPALRTSVMELLAAADSRATCPLCGDPLPAGPKTIVCDRCAAEVGAG